MVKWSAVLFIVAVASLSIQSVYSKNLPSFLTPCKRKDPNINKCMLTFMKTLLKRSPNGIPELKIPPLEPFIIPQIVLDQGSSKAVQLKATLNNIAVYGMTKADLKGVKAIMEPVPNFEMPFSIPSLRIQSDYIIDGKLLIVPIKGSGKCDMNLTEISGVLKLNTKVVDKKGHKYLDVGGRDVEVNLKNGQFYFANLFNGNKQLGETTNAFINENWQELYKELRPVIANAIGSVVEYVVKIVLDDYTFNEIFPEK